MFLYSGFSEPHLWGLCCRAMAVISTWDHTGSSWTGSATAMNITRSIIPSKHLVLEKVENNICLSVSNVAFPTLPSNA